ncbi:MAG: hypothetical protein ACXV8A_00125 [Chthoniobacterales bacterium]
MRAVVYTETGDAGRLPGTAQPTAASQGTANQPLSGILGSILNATDIDLFKINITSPSTFSATTVNTVTNNSGLDTALFLFDSNGRPVYANDDDSSGLTFGATLPAGNALGPQLAGVYYLGISFSGAEPVNSSSIALFTAAASSTDLRGPNPSASGPLANWDTTGIIATGTSFPGSYQIDLTGATTAAVPEPTSFAFALIGGASLVILRQQSSKKS